MASRFFPHLDPTSTPVFVVGLPLRRRQTHVDSTTTARSHGTLTIHLLILTLVFALGHPRVAAAETTSLSGHVLDSQGATLGGAVVRLSRHGGGLVSMTVADASGAYRLEGLVPGVFVIEVEATGFRRRVQTVTLVRGVPASYDFRLEVSGVDESVVVTAAAAPQADRETSKAVTIVDQAEARAADRATVADIVRPMPGVQVA